MVQTRNKIITTAERIAEESTGDKHLKERVLATKADPQDFSCYGQAVRRYSEKCFNLGQVRWEFMKGYGIRFSVNYEVFKFDLSSDGDCAFYHNTL